MDTKTTLAWRTPESVWKGMLRQDFHTWMDVQDESVLQTARNTTGLGDALLREAFLGLYVNHAPLKDPSPDPVRHMHSVFERAEKMPEWRDLRDITGEDEISSAIGAATFAVELYKKLPNEVKEDLKQAEEKIAQSEKSQERSDLLSDLVNSLPKDDPKRAAQEKKQQAAARKAQRDSKQAENALAELSSGLNANQAQIGNAIATASRDSGGKIQELQNASRALNGEEGRGWGLQRGEGGRSGLSDLQKLADYLEKNKHLRQMLKELGWAQRAVSEQMRKSRHGKTTFTHYQAQELDLENIHPDELAGMLLPDGHPARLDFLRRLADDELLHRRYTGEERMGKGPLVYVKDTSLSMKGAPHALQCAFELAIQQQMRREKRRMITINFSGAGQSQVWEDAHPSMEDLIAHIEYGFWGGTEPYGPIRKAIELICADPGMKCGDILITTDGCFGAPPRGFLDVVQEARKEPGLRISALVIGRTASAADFADTVRVVEDLLREREQLAGALGAIL